MEDKIIRVVMKAAVTEAGVVLQLPKLMSFAMLMCM